MKLVYVAGQYRGESPNDIHHNIERARTWATSLWRMGFAVISPHMNSAFMDGACPDDTFLEGDLVMLSRCDAIFMLPFWTESQGAREELKFARANGIPVFLYDDYHDLEAFLDAPLPPPQGVPAFQVRVKEAISDYIDLQGPVLEDEAWDLALAITRRVGGQVVA